MPLVRRLVRIPLLALHVVAGVIVISLCAGLDRLTGRTLHQGIARPAQRFWSWSICRLLGIRIRWEGRPLADPPVLVASNHISWLDILVISARYRVSFLSKEEVRRWPGVGFVATRLGTLYIRRGEHNAATSTIRGMSERLRAGFRVVFFPEGTTSRGHGLLPLRPRLFQAAIDAQAPVQPLVIRYLNGDGSRNANAPFVDQQNMITQVLRLAGESGVHAVVWGGRPVSSRERGRNQLAMAMREQMEPVLETDREPSRGAA